MGGGLEVTPTIASPASRFTSVEVDACRLILSMPSTGLEPGSSSSESPMESSIPGKLQNSMEAEVVDQQPLRSPPPAEVHILIGVNPDVSSKETSNRPISRPDGSQNHFWAFPPCAQ
ncbi:dna mismatch repair protein [Lasius niger]|uniref:Dna mismatch repair protein n=1 Tax=Lasius niger TaxID=67767 RepID=A0A0J7N2Y8_LASNI|nr:dna mismatch repair protein [Lasius niger]